MGSKNHCLLGFILLVAGLFIPGCKEDEQPPKVNVQGGEILIANEGNFGWGEGTLSLYNPDSKSIQNNVYSIKNNESMGNVLHSIASFNGQFFFVVNNSSKVIITDTNFVKQGEITGLTSPRNIYRVGNDKAYVTDLYANVITIIDLKAQIVIGRIPCNGHSEEGVIKDGIFWFTAPETSSVYGVDIATNMISDSIQVGWMPEGIVLDNKNVMWVLNRGDERKDEKPKLTSISEQGADIVVSSSVLDGAPVNLEYDMKLDILYFINEDIWSRSTALDQSQPTLWMAADDRFYYALSVNPDNSEVYVSDIKDFVSKSAIYRYSPTAALIDQFSAGIITGYFFFP
jgi:DNA-binding beta-propeller fold protein YncE